MAVEAPFFQRGQQETVPEAGCALFAIAYGGNGITYSMLGAGLLRAQIERRTHPLAALLSFTRLA